MADNLTTQTGALATIPTGSIIATDDVGGVHYQKVKLDLGGDGASTPVVGSVPVSDGGGSITVDGTVTVQDGGGTLTVDDGGATLSVDGAIGITSSQGLGHTPYKNLDVDESEDQIKGTAGRLFWLHVINLAASPRYLKIYNATAASVVVGTSVPVLTFPIPSLGDTNGAGFTLHFGDAGVAFSTAITIAATTGLADADTGAPGANEVVLNAGFI